jgi:hypothetical protein
MSAIQDHCVLTRCALDQEQPGSAVQLLQPPSESRKRKHDKLAQVPSGGQAVPVEQKLYCTVCKEILPKSAFFPSYMQRHLSWCKSCARVKQIEQRQKKKQLKTEEGLANAVANAVLAEASKRPAPVPSDHTRSMLERLRRGCSQTRHLEGLSRHLTVGFDAKIARPLLASWRWQTALKPAVPADEVARVSSAMIGGVEKTFSIRGYPELRWIVWAKSDLTPIKPWEVIPVTHAEASLFRSVPAMLRPKLVSDADALRIQQHLSQLEEVCLCELGIAMCSLLARHNETVLTPAAPHASNSEANNEAFSQLQFAFR